MSFAKFVGFGLLLGLGCTQLASADAVEPQRPAGLVLQSCRPVGAEEDFRCGSYSVPENRMVPSGRILHLKIVVIPARHPHPDWGPIFELAGGPGQTITEFAGELATSPQRDNQDIVLLDQRGTSDDARLDCPSPGSDQDLEGFLRAPFRPDAALQCLAVLRERFDLTQYSTAAFVQDIDAVREAVGYQRINLSGGSGGTYVALAYMRAYPQRVRTAVLTSVVDPSNRIPLYHAQSAQYALDALFAACAADPACHGAFPNLSTDFNAVLARVHASPVRAIISHPVTGARVEINLTEPSFVDAVRVMLYSGERAHRLPLLIEQANAGDFNPFAEAGVISSRNLYASLRMGLNYAVTCSEFTSRISPDEVEPATRGSFFGAWRVRAQMATCANWPRAALPAGFFDPFHSAVPTLLVSGDMDPVTPPYWGEKVHAYLENSVHIVIPGGHTPSNACVVAIEGQLERTATIEGMDIGCVAALQQPSFQTRTPVTEPRLGLR